MKKTIAAMAMMVVMAVATFANSGILVGGRQAGCSTQGTGILVGGRTGIMVSDRTGILSVIADMIGAAAAGSACSTNDNGGILVGG